MNIIVTGGAGYIGSTFIDLSARAGDLVVSVDNLCTGDYGPLCSREWGFAPKLLVGDIRRTGDLEKAAGELGGLDAVVHLAAISGLENCRRNPNEAVSTNVYGTYNVLELARKLDLRVVFTSSAAVYGTPLRTPVAENHPLRPMNFYGVTKLAGECLMHAYHDVYGLETVVLRLGNVYGVGVFTRWRTVVPRFVRQALEGKPLTVYGDGWQTRDFIHVLDVVEAIRLVLRADRRLVAEETFNVASGKPTSINMLA